MNINRLKKLLTYFNFETILFIIIVMGWATAYYLEVSGLPHPETNMLFIRPCYFVILLCSIYLFIKEIRKLVTELKNEVKGTEKIDESSPIAKKEKVEVISWIKQMIDQHRAVVLLVLSFLYAGILSTLGYLISTFLFLFVIFYVIGALERKWGKLVILSAAITAVMYDTFGIFFQITLPKGILF